jgi:hypothetical protein
VLCVCLDCHEDYEEKANKLKEKLHTQYAVPLKGIEESNKTIIAINGILYTLKEKYESLPTQSVESLLVNLRKHVGYNITLEEAFVMDYHDVPSETYFDTRDSIFMDKYIADSHTYEEFILMWREHFLNSMNPKFISKNWLDCYKTFFKKPQ